MWKEPDLQSTGDGEEPNYQYFANTGSYNRGTPSLWCPLLSNYVDVNDPNFDSYTEVRLKELFSLIGFDDELIGSKVSMVLSSQLYQLWKSQNLVHSPTPMHPNSIEDTVFTLKNLMQHFYKDYVSAINHETKESLVDSYADDIGKFLILDNQEAAQLVYRLIQHEVFDFDGFYEVVEDKVNEYYRLFFSELFEFTAFEGVIKCLKSEDLAIIERLIHSSIFPVSIADMLGAGHVSRDEAVNFVNEIVENLSSIENSLKSIQADLTFEIPEKIYQHYNPDNAIEWSSYDGLKNIANVIRSELINLQISLKNHPALTDTNELSILINKALNIIRSFLYDQRDRFDEAYEQFELYPSQNYSVYLLRLVQRILASR